MFIRQTKIASVVVFHLRTMLSSSVVVVVFCCIAINLVWLTRAQTHTNTHTHTPKHAYTTLTFGLFSHISIPSFFVRFARVLSLSHSLVKYSRLKCFIRFGEFFFRFILLPSLFLRLFSRYTRQYFLRLGWMNVCVWVWELACVCSKWQYRIHRFQWAYSV